MVTLSKISEELGLSEATVSYALNGKGRMKQETREAVYKLAKKYGYVHKPNSKDKYNRVICVFEDSSSNVANQIKSGIDHVCRTNKTIWASYNLDIIVRGYGRTLDSQLLRGLLNDLFEHLPFTPSGMIYISHYPRKVEGLLEGFNIPIISAKMHGCGEIAYIDQDDQQGAYDAVDYLCKTGRRRIATIAGQIDAYSSCERMIGYQRALIDNSISFHPRYVKIGDWEPNSGYELCNELLQITPAPDAIFAQNDGIASGIYQSLHEHGKRIPEDIAIFGFDNQPLCRHLYPTLSSVCPPDWEIGSAAASKMIMLLNGLSVDNLTLPCKIEVRDSCVKPNK